MEPWYKIVTLRREVREGRSFSPDEFAIALEQVVARTAPKDYSDPAQFFLAYLLHTCPEGTRRHGLFGGFPEKPKTRHRSSR